MSEYKAMKILCLLISLLLVTTSLVMGFRVHRLMPTRYLMISAVKKDGNTEIIKKDNGENTKKKNLLGRLKNSRGTTTEARYSLTHLLTHSPNHLFTHSVLKKSLYKVSGMS